MGACEAFEADIEAAARTVLPGGGRASREGQAAPAQAHDGDGAANGSSTAARRRYWRQLGALSLLDGTARCARRLRQGRRSGAGEPRSADAGWASSTCAAAISTPPRPRSAARSSWRMPSTAAATAGSRAIAATPCWATCSPRGRSTTRRWPPTRRHSARSRRCSSATPSNVGLRRDLSVTYDRIGDMHAAKAELDAALESYRQSLEIAEALAARDPHRARCGSTICP